MAPTLYRIILQVDNLDQAEEFYGKLLGDRGRRYALERWTEEVHLERYLGLVRRLMKERAASPQALPGAA